MTWARLASNAVANLISGLSATLFQVGMTAIVARALSPSLFSVWTLALSIAAFVPLFSFNLSTVITRLMIEERAENHFLIRSAGQKVSVRLSIIGMVMLLSYALVLYEVSSPLQQLPKRYFFVLTLLLVGAQIWQILSQTRFGALFSREDNWSVSRVVVYARLGGLFGLSVVVFLGQASLFSMATGLAVGSLFFWILGWKKNFPDGDAVAVLNAAEAVAGYSKKIWYILKGFAIWALGAAVIQYSLPSIVSVIDHGIYNSFYLAFTLNLIVLGFVSAGASALTAPLTKLRVNEQWEKIEQWLLWGSLAVGFVLVLAFGVMWLSLRIVLAHWSPGVASPEEVAHSLFWLALQTILRSIALIYSVILSTTATPKRLALPIVLEMVLTAMIATPLGLLKGSSAFLCGLVLAGGATSVCTCLTLLREPAMRPLCQRKMVMMFLGALVTACVAWLGLCSLTSY